MGCMRAIQKSKLPTSSKQKIEYNFPTHGDKEYNFDKYQLKYINKSPITF